MGSGNAVRIGALFFTLAAVSLLTGLPAVAQRGTPESFSVDRILSIPAPDNLTASPVGSTLAWTFNERGARNIYVADGPDYMARRITAYMDDDGQELTHLSFSSDGKTIVYVRGGDHGSNRAADSPPNPASSPTQPKMQVWAVRLAGGPSQLLGDGDAPVVAPDGNRVAFVRDRRIWIATLDGSKAAEAAFFARGTTESPSWSPDGRTLAFVSNRGDHSFIGLFTPGRPVRYVAPSTSRDSLPTWSPEGQTIAFVRQPGNGGAPRSPLVQAPQKWAILLANPDATNSAVTAVTSGNAPVDPILQNPGGLRLWWGADDHLVFLSYRDGWPHLYSLHHPRDGGRPTLLTPGSFMVEHVTLSPDRRFLIYTANTGTTRADVERRHLFKVAVNAAAPTQLTSGTGIEWGPVVTSSGDLVACLTADARRPPMPSIVPTSGGTVLVIGGDRLPSDFPAARLVVPEPVTFRAADGVQAYGQVFNAPGGGARKPAIVYVHGGGPRQMLLGWHYRWEYANDYAANQYLASRGFIVLSVNYRLSVGYGRSFQFPEHAGARGASEYRDILAAGRYLQARPDVDPARIGIWGASYGGYLTALALGRNSDVFAAGVDMHGVHDRLPAVSPAQLTHALVGDGITEADLRQALKVEFESSPVSAVATWKSPVLLIHGDDDRTVDFRQTIDLERRLLEKGVRVEALVLPDEVHDSLLWRNWTLAFSALSQFFEQTLQAKAKTSTSSAIIAVPWPTEPRDPR